MSTLSLGGLFKGAQVGTQAYVDYVNSTGGVNGRKIVVNGADDGFTGAGNKQATQNALQNDFALVGDFSLEDSFGGAVLAQNPGLPDVSQVLDDATNKLPNVFSPSPWPTAGSRGRSSTSSRSSPTTSTPWAPSWPTRPRPPRTGPARSTSLRAGRLQVRLRADLRRPPRPTSPSK